MPAFPGATPAHWTLAAGRVTAPKETVTVAETGAAPGGRTPGALGGLVAPRPVMKMERMSPVWAVTKVAPGIMLGVPMFAPVTAFRAATGFWPSAVCAKKKNSGVAGCAATI